MARKLPWIIVVVMAAIGLGAPLLVSTLFHLSDASNIALSSAFGGALVGAAGTLVGTLLERWRVETEQTAANEQERIRIKTLIASELVNIAAGHIQAKETIDQVVAQADVGRALPTEGDFSTYMPRTMTFTDQLGTKLIALNQQELDVLATLRSNLELTARAIIEASSRNQPLSQAARKLQVAFGHDCKILAEAFEQFAPTRKLDFGAGNEPVLASVVLRDIAGP